MTEQKNPLENFQIQQATEKDIPIILDFIKALAEYEKLSHEVVATKEDLRKYLFDEKKAEVVIGYYNQEPAGFALYFNNFSTFLGKPGIYLEDLFVHEKFRGKGFGKKILIYLAKLAVEQDCGRLEWAVLDWNEPSIKFYKALGAKIMNEWLITRLTGNELTKLAALN